MGKIKGFIEFDRLSESVIEPKKNKTIGIYTCSKNKKTTRARCTLYGL